MKQPLLANPQHQTSALSKPATDTFETLYNRYVGKVYKKCLAMTKDSESAQDFTQDIFIKVFDKFDSFQNRSAFSTWLYSVAHNYCLDQIRLRKRLNTEYLSDDLATEIADQDTSIDHWLEALEGVMTVLPGEERAFLWLKYEQGLSVKEIASQWQLKESTVKMRLKRTRDKLHKLYSSRESA